MLPAWFVTTTLWAGACENRLDGPDPKLTVAAAEPGLVCVEQLTTAVALTGSGLSPTVFDALTDDERVILPQIDLIRASDLDGAAAGGESIRVPDDEAGGRVRWIDDDRMEFDVSPELGLQPGIYDIAVTNPDGSRAIASAALGGLERPVVTEVVPAHLCLAQGERSFEIRGAGFVAMDGASPTVTVGPNQYAAGEVLGCRALSGPLSGVELCTAAVFTVPADDLPVGSHEIVLTNPAPVECQSSDPAVLEVTAPPRVTAVEPQVMCVGGGEIVITGSDFNERASVAVGGQPAVMTTHVSDTELRAQFGVIPFDPGSYAVTVDQDTCSDTLGTEILIVQGIIAFFVDPSVVFNGIDIQATLFVSGLNARPDRVALVDAAGGEIDLTDSIVFPRPGRVQAVIPRGLPAGEYSVLVEDSQTTCESLLPGAVTVTDQLTLALQSIAPAFGHTASATAVEIRSAEMPAAGEVTFGRTPRAYLSPQGGGVAAQLEAVAFVSPTLLTGVVPAGLPVGTYDLIAVNPTGEVGVIEGAFQVTADPPPEIDEITPGTLQRSTTPQTATVLGRNFQSPTVDLTCRLADGVTIVTQTAGIVDNAASDHIDITVDTSSLDQGTVCIVRATNVDGTFDDFSAIAVANPNQAQNAINFAPGAELVTGRRAPAAAAGRASRTARFVYAIGGDDGGPGGAVDTVEASTVDLFGQLGGFFELPVRLPGPRTLARAVTVADRFIYLVGGNDGTGPTAHTLRAKILDPAERPQVPDIDLTLEDAGLPAGIWYYRLSAVMAPGSVEDPGGGEILASDPLVIQLPDLSPRRVHVHLVWSAVPDAVEYRLYRTPTPDLASGDELLLATIAAGQTQFTDDGSVTPAGDSPLPLGATGRWHALDSLDAARQAHGVTLAPDPLTGDVFHIYAVSGDGGAGDIDSVEALTVAVTSGQQVAGVWTPVASLPAGTGRRFLEALTADAGTASKVGPDVWLYALGGSAGAGTDPSTHAIQVLAGGALDPGGWIAVDAMSPVRTGYAAALANNFLYVLGGIGTAATGHKANICGSASDAGCGGGGAPPDLGGWTSLSDINMQPRALAGKVVQSSFIYVIGGVDAVGNVIATTDQSVLGGQP